jgi:hypothetical protein
MPVRTRPMGRSNPEAVEKELSPASNSANEIIGDDDERKQFGRGAIDAEAAVAPMIVDAPLLSNG